MLNNILETKAHIAAGLCLIEHFATRPDQRIDPIRLVAGPGKPATKLAVRIDCAALVNLLSLTVS